MLPDQLILGRMVRIKPGVVVALERVLTVFHRDDAMKDDCFQDPAVVGDRVARAILVRFADHDEIARVNARLHADSVGGHICDAASELGWPHPKPSN